MAFKREQKEIAKEEKRKKLEEINRLIAIHNEETLQTTNTKDSDATKKIDTGTNTNEQCQIQQNTHNKPNLDELNKMKKELEFDLSEKIYETESNTCIYNQEIQQDEESQVQLIIQLLNNNNVEDFITIIDNAKINLETLEDLVLYNLSEQIKEGNDDIGEELTRIGIYVKYAIESGKSFVYKIKDAMKDPKKRELFDKEVKMQYEASKKAILEMQKE